MAKKAKHEPGPFELGPFERAKRLYWQRFDAMERYTAHNRNYDDGDDFGRAWFEESQRLCKLCSTLETAYLSACDAVFLAERG